MRQGRGEEDGLVREGNGGDSDARTMFRCNLYQGYHAARAPHMVREKTQALGDSAFALSHDLCYLLALDFRCSGRNVPSGTRNRSASSIVGL